MFLFKYIIPVIKLSPLSLFPRLTLIKSHIGALGKTNGQKSMRRVVPFTYSFIALSMNLEDTWPQMKAGKQLRDCALLSNALTWTEVWINICFGWSWKHTAGFGAAFVSLVLMSVQLRLLHITSRHNRHNQSVIHLHLNWDPFWDFHEYELSGKSKFQVYTLVAQSVSSN